MDARTRRHFRAIAVAMAVDADRRMDEAMAKTPLERVVEGLELGQSGYFEESEAELDARARRQAGLQALRRKLERERAAGLGGYRYHLPGSPR